MQPKIEIHARQDSKKLLDELRKLMAEPEGQDDRKEAPPPELSDVLYVDPAPGGERRNCKNCVLWGSSNKKCSIMPGEEATAFHVCGYHVFGSPGKRHIDFEGIHPPDPKFSGFSLVPEGVACENCNWFVREGDEDGVCLAVKKRKKRAHVHPKGVCTRWSTKQTITDPKDPKKTPAGIAPRPSGDEEDVA